jgi:archaellum component FlaC
MGNFELKSSQKAVSQVSALNSSIKNKLEQCQELDNLDTIKKILSDVNEDVERIDDFVGVKFPNIQGMLRNSNTRMKLTEEKLLMVSRDMQDFLNKF